MDWEAGEITAATLRALPEVVSGVTTKGSGGGERCQVLSRTRLVVRRQEADGESWVEEVDSVHEGGVLWHSLSVGPMRAGAVVRLSSAGP